MRRKILEGKDVASWEDRRWIPDRGTGQFSKKPAATGPDLRSRVIVGHNHNQRASGGLLQQDQQQSFCGGTSPETRIRPVPSFRWEATREKAGNFSTSVKRSRTKGRTISF